MTNKVTEAMVTNHEFVSVEGWRIHILGYFHYNEDGDGFIAVECIGAYLSKEKMTECNLRCRIDMLNQSADECPHYESIHENKDDLLPEVNKYYPGFQAIGIMDIDDVDDGIYLIQY
jgi:hypothetical protein